jgi:hypothetical protein
VDESSPKELDFDLVNTDDDKDTLRMTLVAKDKEEKAMWLKLLWKEIEIREKHVCRFSVGARVGKKKRQINHDVPSNSNFSMV